MAPKVHFSKKHANLSLKLKFLLHEPLTVKIKIFTNFIVQSAVKMKPVSV